MGPTWSFVALSTIFAIYGGDFHFASKASDEAETWSGMAAVLYWKVQHERNLLTPLFAVAVLVYAVCHILWNYDLLKLRSELFFNNFIPSEK
jgi:hypothetical protein